MKLTKSESKEINALARRFGQAMLCDTPRLSGQLRRLHNATSINSRDLDKFRCTINASIEKVKARIENRPRPQFALDLPVTQRREEIAKCIQNHQVIILAGETGSGKTTQLPQICLDLGLGSRGYIGHTQPRRIAARSIAQRLSSELATPLGQTVGYKIRFQDQLSEDSYIKVMTDGILLAEIQNDQKLLAYDTLIIDEAHERSLNIDFLLGYLKQLLPKRPELKLIITSATIDTQKFAEHFNKAPVIEISGRTYPVEVRYRPLTDSERESDATQINSIVDAVSEIRQTDRFGDILVFLAGERDIRDTAEALRRSQIPGLEILPLYSRLASGEQNRIFRTSQNQRIVLATNVAETSLTVPGIVYVIDPGKARISRYNYRSKVQRLPIEPISVASANQRKGRCGRIQKGICIRLYGEDDLLNRPEFTEPEILRTSLAKVILQMQSLNLGQIEQFPFLQPPDGRMIKEGYQTLQELGAIDSQQKLTTTGRQLARLPVDPAIGRMILAAKDENCLTEVLIIAAALSASDPREYPHDARDKADNLHRKYRHDKSDFLSFVNLWRFYHESKTSLGTENKLRKFCKKQLLSFVRIREWREVHHQLYRMIREMGFKYNREEASYAAIHRALLAGLLSNAGQKLDKSEFQGTRGSRFMLFPASTLFKKPPGWILAAEKVETSKIYGRCLATIEPEWLEQVAGDLCRHHYFEPHWQRSKGQVGAYDKISLWGLPLVERRQVNFGPIDPVAARSIFIREALVECNLKTRLPFLQHNKQLIEGIENLEAKSRRRDILVDHDQIYAFFDSRLPANIYSAKSFERWYKTEQSKQLFFLQRQDLMHHSGEHIEPQFPDHLDIEGINFALHYRLEPGHPSDGITLIIPIALLHQLAPTMFDWLVPGMLREKLTQLLKGLPKTLRRHFVPVPDYVQRCMESLDPAGAPFDHQLRRTLESAVKKELPPDSLNSTRLALHLQMNFRVLDEDNNILQEGRDLRKIQHQLANEGRDKPADLRPPEWHQTGLLDWTFESLPEELVFEHRGTKVRYYPALIDRFQSVDLELLTRSDEAKLRSREGVRRLLRLKLAKECRQLTRDIPKLTKLCLWFSPVGNKEALVEDILAAVFQQTFELTSLPQTKAEFDALIEQNKSKLHNCMLELSLWLERTLEQHHKTGKALKGALDPQRLEALKDIRDQADHLVYPGFIAATAYQQLEQIPRYMQAILIRLEKLNSNPARDRKAFLEIAPLWTDFKQLAYAKGVKPDPEALENYRWLLEEFRVSLFAQELKTAQPVSAKRLKKYREMLKH